ncbi:MAG: Transcriptional regulator, ArsR family, partial [uncultured Friedmanniella sp.]
ARLRRPRRPRPTTPARAAARRRAGGRDPRPAGDRRVRDLPAGGLPAPAGAAGRGPGPRPRRREPPALRPGGGPAAGGRRVAGALPGALGAPPGRLRHRDPAGTPGQEHPM